MTTTRLISASELLDWMSSDDAPIIVDLSSDKTWQQLHIENAQHISYNAIVQSRPPVNGLIIGKARFESILGSIGWQPGKSMVAYDDEGGGMAGRFIWTCHAYGVGDVHLLDGGIINWYHSGFKWTNQLQPTQNNSIQLGDHQSDNIIEAEEIMQKSALLKLMDCRSAEEYSGARKYAERAGRIPAAIHFDWVNIMDQQNNLCMRPLDELEQTITQLGFEKQSDVVVYCQTHHRSALNYTLLKILGYPNVRGYHGSWSDWGNRHDTPLETDQVI